MTRQTRVKEQNPDLACFARSVFGQLRSLNNVDGLSLRN